MNKVILNEEKYNQIAKQAVELAKGILSNEVEYLEAIGNLNTLRFELCENENDEDFKIFTVVSSEADHIPYGKAKNNCSELWLEKSNKELKEIKEFYSSHVEKSCNSIISRFNESA